MGSLRSIRDLRLGREPELTVTAANEHPPTEEAPDDQSPDGHPLDDHARNDHTRGGYAAGDLIAEKYRLEAVLGTGGMGTVWRARNVTLDVDVALKLIRRETTSHHADQRLLNEARAAAKIRHPSIVSVFDFGQTKRGDPFIVMEVVEGESLAKLLERKVRIEPLMACRLLLPVAHALAAVHRRGIVHRDIKPENIILAQTEPGTLVPKLVDFGVAKVEEAAAHLTRAGAQVGSPLYMAPEQVRAVGEVDERADIWALSVVFYEAITGRVPFDGRSSFELFEAITAAAPTPTTDLGAGDAALWEILKKGLQKEPSARWPTIAALGAALSTFAIERGESTDISGVSLAAAWSAAPSTSAAPDPPGIARASSHSSIDAAPTARAGTVRWIGIGVALAAVIGGGWGVTQWQREPKVAPISTVAAQPTSALPAIAPSNREPASVREPTPPAAISSGPSEEMAPAHRQLEKSSKGPSRTEATASAMSRKVSTPVATKPAEAKKGAHDIDPGF